MFSALRGHVVRASHPSIKSERAFWRSPHLSRLLKRKRFELARSSEERREAEKGSSVKYVGKPGVSKPDDVSSSQTRAWDILETL